MLVFVTTVIVGVGAGVVLVGVGVGVGVVFVGVGAGVVFVGVGAGVVLVGVGEGVVVFVGVGVGVGVELDALVGFGVEVASELEPEFDPEPQVLRGLLVAFDDPEPFEGFFVFVGLCVGLELWLGLTTGSAITELSTAIEPSW